MGVLKICECLTKIQNNNKMTADWLGVQTRPHAGCYAPSAMADAPSELVFIGTVVSRFSAWVSRPTVGLGDLLVVYSRFLLRGAQCENSVLICTVISRCSVSGGPSFPTGRGLRRVRFGFWVSVCFPSFWFWGRTGSFGRLEGGGVQSSNGCSMGTGWFIRSHWV